MNPWAIYAGLGLLALGDLLLLLGLGLLAYQNTLLERALHPRVPTPTVSAPRGVQ